jgi:hypothetical protein
VHVRGRPLLVQERRIDRGQPVKVLLHEPKTTRIVVEETPTAPVKTRLTLSWRLLFVPTLSRDVELSSETAARSAARLVRWR